MVNRFMSWVLALTFPIWILPVCIACGLKQLADILYDYLQEGKDGK
jgi:hypothetical protein